MLIHDEEIDLEHIPAKYEAFSEISEILVNITDIKLKVIGVIKFFFKENEDKVFFEVFDISGASAYPRHYIWTLSQVEIHNFVDDIGCFDKYFRRE